MGVKRWRAAILAALLWPNWVMAQDVTLTSRDGSLSLPGTLVGYDGEFYRIETSYGRLTVDGQSVICEGPACPDLIAPKAIIRIEGAKDAGIALLPRLIAGFANASGLDQAAPAERGQFTALTDPATDKVLAEISFMPTTAEVAVADLSAGKVEMVVATVPKPEFRSRVLALDALVPIVAMDNPVPRISTTDLARALAGDVTNWVQIGGPDMPVVLHAMAPNSDLQRALSARLGRDVVAAVTHPDLEVLADAVASDPWALAVTGQSHVGAARSLPLTDSCGFALFPSALAVKAEDYPLTVPVLLLTPRHRLSLIAREFIDYLSTPDAQAIIAAAGYVDQAVESRSVAGNGDRLLAAIKGAGEETTLADLQGLTRAMEGAERLSLTFRFDDGSDAMDAHSQQNLTDLARLIEAGLFKGKALSLVGFSDGSGAALANYDLSLSRARIVLAALKAAAPDAPETALPGVMAFGEVMPMACDETAAGRRLNRRVELWVRPDFIQKSVRDSPAP